MEIETKHVELRTLTPAAGCFLTQAGDVPAQERVVSEKVYLAVNDAPENWREITAAEAEAIINAQQQNADDQPQDQ